MVSCSYSFFTNTDFYTLICQRQGHSDINVNVIRISMSRSFVYQCQGHSDINVKVI